MCFVEPEYNCVAVLVLIQCLPFWAGGIRLGCKPSRKANVLGLHGGTLTLITCGWLDRLSLSMLNMWTDRELCFHSRAPVSGFAECSAGDCKASTLGRKEVGTCTCQSQKKSYTAGSGVKLFIFFVSDICVQVHNRLRLTH